MKRSGPIAHRAPLKRYAPVKRGKPPRHRVTLKVRGRPRFKTGRDAAYLEWITGKRCVVPECRKRGEPAHVVSRGAGGPDRKNVVPLCREHHRRQQAIGIVSFQAETRLDLPLVALTFDARYKRLGDTQCCVAGE